MIIQRHHYKKLETTSKPVIKGRYMKFIDKMPYQSSNYATIVGKNRNSLLINGTGIFVVVNSDIHNIYDTKLIRETHILLITAYCKRSHSLLRNPVSISTYKFRYISKTQ